MRDEDCMVEKCDGCGKELWFLEGNIYIPSDGDGSKREIYCRKCYDKKNQRKNSFINNYDSERKKLGMIV